MSILTSEIADQLIEEQGLDIVIPDQFTSIEDDAFSNSKIISALIPNSITKIGKFAFSGNNLTSINVPDSVIEIGQGAFASNQLKSVTLPEYISHIDDGAFWSNSISSIYIPSSVESIGKFAFRFNQLESIEIPSSVSSIAQEAFADNPIKNIKIGSVIKSPEQWARWGLGDNINIVLDNNVSIVNKGSFSGVNLESVVIPQGVKEIGSAAFEDNLLRSIIIPDSVYSIGQSAFENNKLEEVDLPQGIDEIEDLVFSSNKLKSIYMPSGITSIGELAFSYNELIEVQLPENLSIIEDGAFWQNNLSNIKIPDNVTEVGNYAFKYNQLETIEVPSSVSLIGNSAFEENKIREINISDGVSTIGDYAFAHNQLTNVYIPNSVNRIGIGAFWGNPLLKSISVLDDTIIDGLNQLPLPNDVVISRRTPILLDENILDGTTVLTLTTFEDYDNYEFVSGDGDTHNNAFIIDGNDIKIVNSPDFEKNSSYTIRIKSINNDGLSIEDPISIIINNVNEPPSNLTLSTLNFDENIASGSVIASLNSSDDDVEDIHTYSLIAGAGGSDNNLFTLTNAQLKILNSPDFESKSSYSIRVQAQDSDGLSLAKTFKLTVNDIKEVTTLKSIKNLTSQDKITTFKLLKPLRFSSREIDSLIVGTKGRDTIIGTSKPEVLAGKEGKDLLRGKKGGDGFLFQGSNRFGKKKLDIGKNRADIIKDFKAEEGDSILLDHKIFGPLNTIHIKPYSSKNKVKKAAKSKNDFVYDDKKGLLYFNENGIDKGWGDGGLFAKLQGAPELGAEDFTIV